MDHVEPRVQRGTRAACGDAEGSCTQTLINIYAGGVDNDPVIMAMKVIRVVTCCLRT